MVRDLHYLCCVYQQHRTNNWLYAAYTRVYVCTIANQPNSLSKQLLFLPYGNCELHPRDGVVVAVVIIVITYLATYRSAEIVKKKLINIFLYCTTYMCMFTQAPVDVSRVIQYARSFIWNLRRQLGFIIFSNKSRDLTFYEYFLCGYSTDGANK